MMKGFSTFVNLYAAGMDPVPLPECFHGSNAKVHEKDSNRYGRKSVLRNVKIFTRYWIETYSETFKEFLKSGHFASDMGKLNSHLMDFQKYNREMLEENYLEPMDLPTKTDIGEINKELYSLKKTVKQLTNQIKN
jgi:polyhydroxyalkanoate synthesis regulator phasin